VRKFVGSLSDTDEDDETKFEQDSPDIRRRNSAYLQNFVGGLSDSDDEDNTVVRDDSDENEHEFDDPSSKRLRYDQEASSDIQRRNSEYVLRLLGPLSDTDEDVDIFVPDGSDEYAGFEDEPSNDYAGFEDPASDRVQEEEDSSSQEHSISSEGEEQDEDELEVGVSSPRRGRTHVENEKAHQENLFLLLPQLHHDRIRMEALRLTGRERRCEGCETLNPTRLWRCNECVMGMHSSPMQCDECMVQDHINKPHCMDVLCQGETLFRKPLCHEIITFKLAIRECPTCKLPDPLGSIDSLGGESSTMTVLVASQNGIFHCVTPNGKSSCSACDVKTVCGPVAFGCLPCEPLNQSGSTWFTDSLLSFIRTMHSEGGISANALARAIMKHWISRSSFLVDSQRQSNISPVANITVKWLEKKLARIITNGILLEHPSWIDGGVAFTLDDRLASVCAACHETCAQVHIDGNFKMRRMRRAKSYREPKLHFFAGWGKKK
jgi:hypothetical protein